ncbi:MAG: hypothetical protein HOH22_18580 [Rhodospirillaceae bacterium]|nr:hypothetical protein [Rhodospirillaceae bacterium]
MSIGSSFRIILLAWALASTAAAVTTPSAMAQTARFLSVIDDLPLMEGLNEDGDAAISFDSPTGRIVEAFASGPVAADVIAAFYAETLPQLGWRRTSDQLFSRDDEVLKVEIGATKDGVTGTGVRFTLRPAGS